MLRSFPRIIPEPPSAGRRKLVSPEHVRRRWFVAVVLLLVAGAIAWPWGLGSAVDQMRREFCAIGYLQSAMAEANGQPVRREEALHSVDRAVALSPETPLVVENAAQLYVNLRAYEQAVPWLQRQGRRGLLTSVSLGQCLLMSNREQEGRSVLGAALEETVRLRRTQGMPDSLYALLMNNIGYVYAEAGEDLAQARSLIGEALRNHPLQPAYTDSMGWVEYKLGHYEEAAFYLERAVRLYAPQESAEMYYHLGAAYARVGRLQPAARALRRCLELDDSWGEARRELEKMNTVLPAPVRVRGPEAPPVRPPSQRRALCVGGAAL